MIWPVLYRLSEAAHRIAFGPPDMTLCARAWWRRDRLFWRLWVTVFDRLFRWVERDHCRQSYERRWR